MPVPVWKLGAVHVLALGCLGVAAGFWLIRKIPLLDRLQIPVPIAGGFIYAIAAWVLRDRWLNFDVDTVLRDLFMVAFMTTIGLSARWKLLARGGVQMAVLLGISSAGAVLQNALGIGLAKILGVHPLLGILSGSVALTGGPATALAFGSTFEKLGVEGATAIAFASATFGIAVAGLMGGYIGGWLIRRRGLTPRPAAEAGGLGVETGEEQGRASLLGTVIVVGVAMGIGSLLSGAMERAGLILPSYIGAMIAAALIRNLDDRFGFARVSQHHTNAVSVVSLYLFITMAMLTLRLWDITRLALPLIGMLVSQVILCWAMCVTMCFRAMGRDYEAAVMSGGFCGFMLGITANAVACMDVLTEKFGPAPRAFLVVPVVGAFLIDFTNSLIITAMANWMR